MKKVFFWICATSLVCSCNRNDVLPPGGDRREGDPPAVTFAGGLAGRSWTDSTGADTRATDTEWTPGDAVGIYMLTKTGDVFDTGLSTALWQNRKYTVDAAGGLNPDGHAHTLYYPVNGDSVRFTAYCPYSASASSAHTVSFDFTDQGTKADKEARDFIFHRGDESFNRDHPATSLNSFYHRFSKIRVLVRKDNSGISCAGMEVTMGNMPKTATVDLALLADDNPANDAAAVTTTAETTTVRAYTVSEDTLAIAEAIVAPHTGGGNFTGRVFTFRYGGREKTYALDDAVTFEPGKVYTFTLLAGLTAQPATYSPDGMTNCYMVAPGDQVSFTVARAYVYDADAGAFTDTLHTERLDGLDYFGTFGAEVMWEDPDVIEDVQVRGLGKDAIVTVRTKSGAAGNAGVKIYKKEDINKTPVWSYHIWVTTYKGDNPVTMKNGHKFMDRNLGATANDLSEAAYGLYYQWGRKDPFRDSSNNPTYVNSTVDNGTIIYSIKNPTCFIKGVTTDVTVNDWIYGSTRNNYLWNQQTTNNKTIYDPCPAGWRVPAFKENTADKTCSPWYEYQETSLLAENGAVWSSTGYVFTHQDNTKAYYPAAGFRRFSSGSLDLGGTCGHYWSASVNSYYGCYLRLESSVHQFGTSTRACGLSVRCVQENVSP
jgi:uncharacterized protein (TIGR02145 family)